MHKDEEENNREFRGYLVGILPGKTLIFQRFRIDPYDNENSIRLLARVRIRNLSNAPILYKLKARRADQYRVKRHIGRIAPDDWREAVVTLLPGIDDDAVRENEFMIMAIICKDKRKVSTIISRIRNSLSSTKDARTSEQCLGSLGGGGALKERGEPVVERLAYDEDGSDSDDPDLASADADQRQKLEAKWNKLYSRRKEPKGNVMFEQHIIGCACAAGDDVIDVSLNDVETTTSQKVVALVVADGDRVEARVKVMGNLNESARSRDAAGRESVQDNPRTAESSELVAGETRMRYGDADNYSTAPCPVNCSRRCELASVVSSAQSCERRPTCHAANPSSSQSCECRPTYPAASCSNSCARPSTCPIGQATFCDDDPDVQEIRAFNPPQTTSTCPCPDYRPCGSRIAQLQERNSRANEPQSKKPLCKQSRPKAATRSPPAVTVQDEFSLALLPSTMNFPSELGPPELPPLKDLPAPALESVPPPPVAAAPEPTPAALATFEPTPPAPTALEPTPPAPAALEPTPPAPAAREPTPPAPREPAPPSQPATTKTISSHGEQKTENKDTEKHVRLADDSRRETDNRKKIHRTRRKETIQTSPESSSRSSSASPTSETSAKSAASVEGSIDDKDNAPVRADVLEALAKMDDQLTKHVECFKFFQMTVVAIIILFCILVVITVYRIP